MTLRRERWDAPARTLRSAPWLCAGDASSARGTIGWPANHAEIIALRNADALARGATLYVTLEPCCHLDKRTPPCTDAIVSSGAKRVVIAAHDPNPRVSGRGIARLRKHEIETSVGILSDRAKRLNEAYARWITTGRPFVTLKIASTLDGKIATSTGESRWITGAHARNYTHQLRHRVDAVLVGLGTILADDPEPRRRRPRRRTPHRVIVDERLATPPTARALRPREESVVIVATTRRAPAARRRRLEQRGARVLTTRSLGGMVDLRDLMRRLGAIGITSVLIEGGAEINASALRSGVVQKVVVMLAPKLLGGRDAIGAIGGRSPKRLDDAVKLRETLIRRSGEDVIVEGYL
jgi:diaminohydroxyphosphoribosylaminopyrimidine deaminase/5-amino-6-(5-phosphoribosylamino)uracil reductase